MFIVLLCIGGCLPISSFAFSKDTSLDFLLLATEDVHLIYRRFLPVQQYLERELKVPVHLRVGRNYEAALETIGQGKCDLAYLDPAAYCEARHKYGVQPVVKVVMNDQTECHSVFITRRDSPLEVFADIAGNSLALGNVHSSYSYLMPLAMLQEIGLKLSDFSSVGFLQKEDRVALSVLVGDYQVGALSNEVAKRYIPYGLRVIETSESLPQYVLCASEMFPLNKRQRLQNALLDYRPQDFDVLCFAPISDRQYNIVRIILKNITGTDYLTYPESAVKLALLPLYSPIKLNKMFFPLARYLSQETGREFRLVIPKDFDTFIRLVKENQVHFAYQNPYVTLLLSETSGIQPLALTISPEPEQPRDRFRGVIVTRKDSAIKELSDLCGQEIMIVSYKSAGGYLFQKMLLDRMGFNIQKQARLVQGYTHEEVVLAVYRGNVSAGFVRESALNLVSDVVELKRLRILATTPYYPNWPFVATPRASPELTKQVQEVLIHCHDKRMLNHAGIIGFIIPDQEAMATFKQNIETCCP